MTANLPVDPRPARKNPLSGSYRKDTRGDSAYAPTRVSIPVDASEQRNEAALLMHREQLAMERTKESGKGRRLGLTLAAAFMLVAATLVVMAPANREFLSYWVSGALLLFAVISALTARRGGKARAKSTSSSNSSGSNPYFMVDQDKRSS